MKYSSKPSERPTSYSYQKYLRKKVESGTKKATVNFKPNPNIVNFSKDISYYYDYLENKLLLPILKIKAKTLPSGYISDLKKCLEIHFLTLSKDLNPKLQVKEFKEKNNQVIEKLSKFDPYITAILQEHIQILYYAYKEINSYSPQTINTPPIIQQLDQQIYYICIHLNRALILLESAHEKDPIKMQKIVGFIQLLKETKTKISSLVNYKQILLVKFINQIIDMLNRTKNHLNENTYSSYGFKKLTKPFEDPMIVLQELRSKIENEPNLFIITEEGKKLSPSFEETLKKLKLYIEKYNKFKEGLKERESSSLSNVEMAENDENIPPSDKCPAYIQKQPTNTPVL